MTISVLPFTLADIHHPLMYSNSNFNGQYQMSAAEQRAGEYPAYHDDTAYIPTSNGSSVVTSPAEGLIPGGAPANAPSEGKLRLRKACDSCSIRKVKVGSTTTSRCCHKNRHEHVRSDR